MVEVDVVTEGGVIGTGAAPTGSSVGMYESCVLRTATLPSTAVSASTGLWRTSTRSLPPVLVGMDVADQAAIDRCMIELDGTLDKHVLGGNAIYSVSVAGLPRCRCQHWAPPV